MEIFKVIVLFFTLYFSLLVVAKSIVKQIGKERIEKELKRKELVLLSFLFNLFVFSNYIKKHVIAFVGIGAGFEITKSIILSNSGYIAMPAAATDRIYIHAPPCAPPVLEHSTPPKPASTLDFEALKTLVLTAYIPFFLDISNEKTEQILADFHIKNYISEKVANSICAFNYQTLFYSDFAGFEKKIYLEISRKLQTLISYSKKYNYCADAVKSSGCEPITKKAILAYLSFFTMSFTSLDTMFQSDDDGKPACLLDLIADTPENRLENGETSDNEFKDCDPPPPPPLLFKNIESLNNTKNKIIKAGRRRVKAKKIIVKQEQQLSLFGQGGAE